MANMISQRILPAGTWSQSIDRCRMTYDERFLRRKVVQTAAGQSFLVDLPKVTSLGDGDGFELADGRVIAISAANEPLLAITSPDLTRVAWHIGNRHTPCQIESNRLLIQRDHVMIEMLKRVGADVSEVNEPFTPEGGAYGLGRTHGHDHGHAHGPDAGHVHEH